MSTSADVFAVAAVAERAAMWFAAAAREQMAVAAAVEARVELLRGCWSGPRSVAVTAAASGAITGWRPVPPAIAAIADVLGAFAVAARGAAVTLADSERAVVRAEVVEAVDPTAVTAALAARRSARARWHELCDVYAMRLRSSVAAIESVIARRSELSSVTIVPAAIPAAVTLPGPIGFARAAGTPIDPTDALIERLLSLVGNPLYLAAAVSASWDQLTEEQRLAVIAARPDIVAFVLVPAGIVLTEAEWDALDAANSYGQFSREFSVETGITVNARIVTVELGADASAVMTKMSDGTVEIWLTAGAGAGVGIAGDSGSGTAEAFTGVRGAVGQKLHFDDENEALAGLATLRAAAAAGKLSVWEFAPQRAVVPGSPVNQLGPVGDALDAFSTLVSLPRRWLRSADAVEEALDDLYAEHGVLRSREGGVYVSAGGEFDLGTLESELRADVSLVHFTETPAAGSDELARSGLLLSGAVVASASSAAVTPPATSPATGSAAGPATGSATGSVNGSPAGGVARAEAVFRVAEYERGGSRYASVFVQAMAEGGLARELLDAGAVEVEHEALVGGRLTVELEVPLTAEVGQDLLAVVSGLPHGAPPPGALAALFEQAEVTLAVDVVGTVRSEADLDAGIITIEVSSTTSEAVNQLTLHKHPGGQFFDRAALDQLIDEHRAE